MLRRAWVLGVALILSLPIASATDGNLRVESSLPLALDASVTFAAKDGAASIKGHAPGEHGAWMDVTGQLVSYTWRAAVVPTADPNSSFAEPLERAKVETF